MSKLLQKKLSRRLVCWLYPLVAPHIHGAQHGFLAKRRTDSALLALEFVCFGLRNDGAPARGWLFLLDVCRAFPSLHHDLVRVVIRSSGVPTWLQNALGSSILNCKTSFELHTSLGREFSLHCGFLQGDPLSAFMFIWALDVVIRAASYRLLRGCSIGVFVDDLAVMLDVSVKSSEWFEDLRLLCKQAGGLLFNFKKMKAISLDLVAKQSGLPALLHLSPQWSCVVVVNPCQPIPPSFVQN